MKGRKVLESVNSLQRQIKKIDLFVNFYNHAKEQHSFAPDAVLNYEEIKDSKDVIGISTSVFFSKKPQSEAEVIHQFLNMDDVYFYATVKGSKAPQPIDFCGEIEKIISTKKQTVTIGGIAYYDAVAVEHFKEGISLVFGESLRYTIYHNGKNPECLVSLSPMLRQRYIDLQFILKVIEVGCFYIDGITMTIVPEKPIDEITAELNSMLSYVEKIIRIFEKLNIVDDLNLDNMSNDDHKKINWLLKYYKETDTDKFDSNNSIEKWKIQNLKLMLFIHQDNEQKTIHNKLSSNHIVRYTTDDEEYLMPIYAILSIDDYATLSNINYDDLVLAYTQRVDRRLYDIKRVNTEALKLISAYDISNNNHQLSSAKAIFEYIYGFADSFLKLVIRINILQIIKRERDFTNEEIQELLIIADGSDANDVKACIYLLLDNKPQAEFYYNRLNEEAKNSFLQFPICKFM